MELTEQKPPWKTHGDFFQSSSSTNHPASLFIFKPEWNNDTIDMELQKEKDLITQYEKHHIWELAKKMANPYECIYTQDDNHFHPSLCILRPLSRSFYKMIEMMHILQFFERLPKQTQKLRSAHVAEGPGGFIEAFLELAEKNKKFIESAHAMTLKPTDNHIPGWRRATTFLQRHKEIILEYGDGTGDIYKKVNQDIFVNVANKVHLFTADGGFDFSTDYQHQEKSVYHLLICSALIGLRCLHLEGSFILKLFDIYSEHTQILLSLIGRCFKEWMLYKPSTSRPCNSERYLLCRGYRGQNKEVLAMLTKMEEMSSKGHYASSESYLIEKERAYFSQNSKEIVLLQKNALTEARAYIYAPSRWKEDFNQHFKVSHEWCSKFHMPMMQKAPNCSSVQAVVSHMTVRAAGLQLQKPDAEIILPLPSDPVVQALSQETVCDTLPSP